MSFMPFSIILNNGFDSCRFNYENIYNSLELDCNRDDSDTSMIRESSFQPAPTATSTLKCSNKNIKSFLENLRIMCINCDSLRSVGKRD